MEDFMTLLRTCFSEEQVRKIVQLTAERMKTVEKPVPPDPAIFIPCAAALLTHERQPVSSLLVNVLGKAVEEKSAHELHPAFPEIMRQLSAIDLSLLYHVAAARRAAVLDVSLVKGELTRPLVRSLIEFVPDDRYDRVQAALGNLHRLGLIETTMSPDSFADEPMASPAHETIRQMFAEVVEQARERIQKSDTAFAGAHTRLRPGLIELTAFGDWFRRGCMQ